MMACKVLEVILKVRFHADLADAYSSKRQAHVLRNHGTQKSSQVFRDLPYKLRL